MGTQGETLASASGLRPLSAFVVIGAVIAGVALQVSRLALAAERHPGYLGGDGRERVESGWHPSYSIEDREGRVLARFVSRYGIELSPRSMWQAHTPEHMARVLSEALGGVPDPETLLAKMLPGAEEGVLRASAWSLAPLEAERVALWIARGGARGASEARPPLAGIGIERDPEAHEDLRFRMAWAPAVLLSEEARAIGGFGASRPIAWSRHLALGLSEALPERTAALAAVLARERPGTPDSELRIDAVWSALLPSAWCRLPLEIGPEEEREVARVLAAEGVNRLQMQVKVERERRYPLGTSELFGDWGFKSPSDTERRPRGGLEALCDGVLAELAAPAALAARYSYLANRPGGRGRERRDYFLEATDAGAPPRVSVTLDHTLGVVVRRELERVLAEHSAVLAMALVVDVASGDVLAVDGVHGYGLPGFLPTYYQFTPGSTYKVVTAAAALEAGVVEPETRFDVGHGPWKVPGASREIHEAEGTVDGVLTLAECVAHSSNRGMVQVGLRVPAESFHDFMQDLGYGRAPETGLGPASSGRVTPLPWRPAWDQASFAFGHQMLTTLWQHAAGVLAIVRGGEWKPLGLVDSVEADGVRTPWPRTAGRRVMSAETAAEVRAMMELGAREGTGKHLFRPELAMGTKTGTAEKVPTELCAHREARAIREHGRAPLKAERTALVREGRAHPGSCYTSSIMVFGSLPEQRERELFVLVVVEEPVKNGKYGGRVAGPAAMAILDEALGVTVRGARPVASIVDRFAPLAADPAMDAALARADAEPWRAPAAGER